jgi:ACS family D-galactonate transporter-like MFS transporter
MIVAAAFFCGLFLTGAVWGSDATCILLLMLTALAFGVSAANLWAITQRLAGREAVGRWCGMQLFVGNLSGVVAPALTGYLVDRTGHFRWPFLVTSAVLWIGGLIWLFVVGAVEPVNWEKYPQAPGELQYSSSGASS